MEGVLFDMGDVLYDATSWRRWMTRVLRSAGVPLPYSSLWWLWDRHYLDRVHRGLIEYRPAFVTFLEHLGLSAAVIQEIEAATWAWKRQAEGRARPLPGTRQVLSELVRRGFVLGVLSDSESPAGRLREKLRKLELGSLFRVVISSIDIGVTKPDPRGYRQALKEMNLLPEQAWFVGHDADELDGAHDVGMRTVAFNFTADVHADCYLRRLDDLIPALTRRTTPVCQAASVGRRLAA